MKRITLATAYLTAIGILAFLQSPGLLLVCDHVFGPLSPVDQPPTLTIREGNWLAPVPFQPFQVSPTRQLPDIQIVHQ
ncbi:hypothetical protein [Larkinella humicola]|uniref:Uncharacterized protein n=1 Tax=Larkinella humicola TaxID=2607654 RepID=A0A5N1JAJ7_9BACT|nr:hypothetical protein [Larkinella humicola]KAA9347838.1 hypothetical protein F0P93_24730 [Larkinella humicola]